MILAAAILDWVLFFSILGLGAFQGYRTGRVTRSSVLLVWLLLPLHAGVFSAFASSLPQPERHQWSNAFPEGTHVLAFIVFGWWPGILMCGLGVLVRRIVRREPLFQRSRQEAR